MFIDIFIDAPLLKITKPLPPRKMTILFTNCSPIHVPAIFSVDTKFEDACAWFLLFWDLLCEKISDKNTGNADGQVLFCYQEDASFGVCRYKVEYKQNQDTLFALFSNIDTLGIGPFKAIFPGKMKINTIVIDCGDSILLYLGTDADSKKLPGIKGQLEDSFSSRMDAIYKWFLTQF